VTTHPEGERVEITPEMLDHWAKHAEAAYLDGGSCSLDVPCRTMRALVDRIKDLEKGMREAIAEREAATWWCACGDSVAQGDRIVQCDTCGPDLAGFCCEALLGTGEEVPPPNARPDYLHAGRATPHPVGRRKRRPLRLTLTLPPLGG
jgi:hypothetical protein